MVLSGSLGTPRGWAADTPTPAAAEAVIDQQLHEEAAEGMTDDDRSLVETTDELLVVVDDLADRDRLERRRVGADRFDISFQARP